MNTATIVGCGKDKGLDKARWKSYFYSIKFFWFREGKSFDRELNIYYD
jgi:hypothetical protein